MAIKIEVRAKDERGHRRIGRFWAIEPSIVEVTEAEAAELEACSLLITRRMDAVAEAERKVVVVVQGDEAKSSSRVATTG